MNRERLAVSTILDLVQGVPVQTFEPGKTLFDEGSKSGVLCFLIDGEVEILKGEFQVNTVREPGAVFGEMSILLNAPHTATVRALTSVRVHLVKDGDAFLRSHQEIAYDLLKSAAQRLR